MLYLLPEDQLINIERKKKKEEEEKREITYGETEGICGSNNNTMLHRRHAGVV